MLIRKKEMVGIEKRVKCTECDYIMPLTYSENAECRGVFVQCKGRNCKKTFEIKIKNGKQVK